MADVFDAILAAVTAERHELDRIEKALKKINIAGSATTIVDYVSGSFYRRNTLVVDTFTETVYRTTIPEGFIATNIQEDMEHGRIKLVGYESQFVTFPKPPTQDQLDMLPEDVLVAIYSPQDDPYTPALETDNVIDPNTNNNNQT